MPWIHLDVEYHVHLKGSLHIGTGHGRGLVQRTIVKQRMTGYGAPAHHVYIPASSLKGKVRSACEMLSQQAGLTICKPPHPETMCGRTERGLCVVCRVFGAPGCYQPDGRRLYWQDACLTAPWRRATETRQQPIGQTVLRTQVQLSRSRGMAAEDHLYTSELAAPGLTFAGRISGWLDATLCTAGESVEDGPCYYEVGLLLASLRMISTLGGGRSRGAGQCEVYLPSEVAIRRVPDGDTEHYSTESLLEAAVWLALYEDERASV